MTTSPDDDVTQTTGIFSTAAAASSTWSRGAGLYFDCAVIFIGVIGTITNGLILYALVVSQEYKKKFLIFNQNVLDFFSSVCLAITYSVNLGNIYLSGVSGYWLCILILGEYFVWVGFLGSKISLVSVTIERYLKVVHTNLSKKVLRKWVIYAMAGCPWVIASGYTMAVLLPTTAVVDGYCYSMFFWSSQTALIAYTLFNFLAFYVSILVIIIYCYGHILVVLRRQARVMAAHSHPSASNAAQNRTDQRIQSNVIKTMTIVSACFALCNLPAEVNFVVMSISQQYYSDFTSYYVIMIIMFLYVCVNPFVYASKFNPVKLVLMGLIPCAARNTDNIVTT